MAPELGFSTYKRYKSGTREFTSWLAQTAKSLSADVLPTIPLAGKKGINGGRKRKAKNKNENGNSVKANSHGDYEIQIADFLPLAQLIADYEVPVPDHIYTLLGNVIMLRKEASAWLRSSESQESHPAIGENHDHDNDHDHGHEHFISVLSHVKNILRKCVGSKIPEKQKDIFAEVQKSTTNMFEKLGVEETKTEPDQPVKTPITTVSTVTAVQTQGAKFDIAGHDEVLFACIFFFQDFHSTRLLLREAWKDYRDGKDSLMAVSLITNTAIELIQRAVTELLTEINGRDEHAPTERNLIHWVYCHVAMNVDDFEEEGDIINMANYEQADILCKITDLILEEWVAETSWKQLGFVSPDDILESNYGELHPRDQIIQDRIFSAHMLQHLHNFTVLKLELPAMDDITTGIASIEADRNKTIPLWFTLAYQILLDIRHVLGNRGAEAFSDLQESGSEISLGVKKYFDFSRTITGKSKTWHTDNDPQIRKLPQFNKDWLQRDFVVFAIKKHGKQRPMALDFNIMCPPYFLLKNHPLLCGSLQYWMHHCHRQWQISLTNCYDSILACAHLYNAARQSGFFTQNWTEMDQVVYIHGAQRIFIGAIPTTPRDFFTRFQMVLSVSAVNFAGKTRAVMDGRRQPTQSNKSLGARRLRKTLPIHDVFEGRYTRLEKQSDLSVHKIDALIASMKPSLHDHLVQPANTWTSTRKIHTNDLLMMLGLALSENIPELHFDYLSLHICCANFLSRLRSSFIANADNDFDSLYRAVSREDASRALELGLSQPSLALILRDIMLVDDKSLALHLVSSILLVHPDALKAAGGSFKNAELWSGVLTCSGVNLKVASDSLAMFLDIGDLKISENLIQ